MFGVDCPAVARPWIPCPVNDDGGIGTEPDAMVVRIAELRRPRRNLDVQNRTRSDVGMKRERADTGQPAADTPRAEHLAVLRWARIPPLPNPDHEAPVPGCNVDLAWIDTAGQQLSSTDEPAQAIDHVE